MPIGYFCPIFFSLLRCPNTMWMPSTPLSIAVVKREILQVRMRKRKRQEEDGTEDNCTTVMCEPQVVRKGGDGNILADDAPQIGRLISVVDIGGDHVQLPVQYGGNLAYHQTTCSDLWACCLTRDELYRSLSPDNKAKAETACADRRGCIYLWVFGRWICCACPNLRMRVPNQRSILELSSK